MSRIAAQNAEMDRLQMEKNNKTSVQRKGSENRRDGSQNMRNAGEQILRTSTNNFAGANKAMAAAK